MTNPILRNILPALGGFVSMFEAMRSIIQPRWLYYVNPIFGVIGVLLGARLDKGDAA